MKHKKKIFNSIICAAAMSVLIPIGVNAEILNDFGSANSDATINNVISGDSYTVNISWDSLKYTYSKISDNSYEWIPVASENEFGASANRVKVENQSTTAINAELSWTPAITGVTAEITGNKTNEKNFDCLVSTMAESPYGWGGASDLYVSVIQPSYLNTTYYSENTCTTEVTEGTQYEANKYYYKELVKVPTSSSAVIEAPTYDATGKSNTTLTWMVDLKGGSLEDVQQAFATNEKKIGTLTVTISDTE